MFTSIVIILVAIVSFLGGWKLYEIFNRRND